MTIRLYYFPSPNGQKISIALEEMGLDYQLVRVNLLEGEQKKPEFVALSPNACIPALDDVAPDGEKIELFESGAILQYLGRKSGRFYPAREPERCQVDAWLFWQTTTFGPMHGQLNFFKRAANTPGRDTRDYAYGIGRYGKKVREQFAVLEQRLAGRDYICEDYSIADMAVFPWVDRYHVNVEDINHYPEIVAWRARIGERPAVQRALAMGFEGLPTDSVLAMRLK